MWGKQWIHQALSSWFIRFLEDALKGTRSLKKKKKLAYNNCHEKEKNVFFYPFSLNLFFKIPFLITFT